MKRKDVLDAYRLSSNRSKKSVRSQYFTNKIEGNRRKSFGNEYEHKNGQKPHLKFEPDDYVASLNNLKKKRKQIKNVTIESSRNSSKIQISRPMSTRRKHVIGLFKCDDSRLKNCKSSQSPVSTSRNNYSSKAMGRSSNRSTKRIRERKLQSVNDSKRCDNKGPKASLKITLTANGSISPSHNSARSRSSKFLDYE